ncbi:MAG: hypothetical protein J6D47_07590 [Peptostreptococcaceae bacterium]|nr:hypothetical protein [Peptostreptococcaceae bacterium]
MSKYFKVDNKTLATALNYCGFSFMKIGDKEKPIYSFEDSDSFREALESLNKIRKKNNKYFK